MLLLLVYLGLAVLVHSEKNLRIEISDGKIEGTILESRGGRKIHAFRSIPFAEPPLGPLRFKPPVPSKPWKNILDATKTHAICPQKDLFIKSTLLEGNEDCLYLNVYTPQLRSEELLPVMVFFHGGGFIVGSGDHSQYGPEKLLDQDIVLVIGNYRLGALGFLSTSDEASPGNYGLKDQSLLLKWVNKNIEHFGGDPNEVTLFGESAGAASSNFHMFSPLSRGFFKRVISQSGSVFNFWALAPKDESLKNAKKLAESVNCSTSSNKILVECLRNIDPLVLVDQDTKFMEWSIEPVKPFKPVVEPTSDEAFLIDTPYNLLKTGQFADVPWIVGMTVKEGLFKLVDFIRNPALIDDLNEDFNDKAAISLNYRDTVDDINAVGEKINKFYFGNEKIEAEKSYSALTDMYTDGWFAYGLDEAIRMYRKVSTNPIFNYVFDHNGPISFSWILGAPGKFYGSCHEDDLIYLFPNIQGFFPDTQESEDDKKYSKFLTTLWANFARTGNPTPKINNIIQKLWKPVTSDKLEYYFMSPEVQEMRDVLLEDRLKFWRSLPIKNREEVKDEL